MVAAIFIIGITVIGAFILFYMILHDMIEDVPDSRIRKLFTPGTIIKTYYFNGELAMIYQVTDKQNESSDWLDLSFYSPHTGNYLGNTQRLINGLTKFTDRCEVYKDGLLVAVFEKNKKPVFYGLNFKKRIKINIPELYESR
jgi:hypothetical protein